MTKQKTLTGKRCKCGCGKFVDIQKHHKYKGAPDYIHGHHAKDNPPETAFEEGNEPWNKGLEDWCSEEHIEKMRKGAKNMGANSTSYKKGDERITGKNNPNWKGGTTPIIRRIREGSKYQKWREKVYERDNYTCQKCGQRGGELHADHIEPFATIVQKVRIDGELSYEKAMDLDELWDVDNGRTLCVECHRKTETYGYFDTEEYEE